MKSLLNRTRNDLGKIPTWKFILFCFLFLTLGAAMGAASKLGDVYFSPVGEVTSRIGIWILLGVIICTFTKHPVRAAMYELLFCFGMIAAYYSTAMVGGFYYSKPYITGWSVFALFTPIFSFFAWYAGGRGAFAWILRIGILLSMLGFAFVFGAGVSDLVFAALIIFITLKMPKEEKP